VSRSRRTAHPHVDAAGGEGGDGFRRVGNHRSRRRRGRPVRRAVACGAVACWKNGPDGAGKKEQGGRQRITEINGRERSESAAGGPAHAIFVRGSTPRTNTHAPER
jgi:hypothetical protein